MKPNHSHSPTEQTALRLWGQFNRRNQEGFWQQYEALLRDSQTVRIEKASIRMPQKPVSVPKLIKKRSFKPNSEQYVYSSLVVIAYLAITALIVISVIQSEIPLIENQAIIIAVSSYLALFIFTVKFTLGFNIFKTDAKYLLIYRPFFFAHSYEKWDNIASIVIEKDLSGEGGIKQTLILKTFEQKTRKYNYPLSQENHALFFEYLKAKVPNTQFKVKGQTMII
ncbi:hypothetical protein BKI52_21655 [marine bacterium AO1-C]|nr:hypothetical protein BKI52_21655 [marine bacterium AO1-C]